MALNALDRHLALIGFMGAGKTTLAEEVAARLGRRAVDADRLLEGRAQISIPAFFAQRGETEFRVAEASLAREPSPGATADAAALRSVSRARDASATRNSVSPRCAKNAGIEI